MCHYVQKAKRLFDATSEPFVNVTAPDAGGVWPSEKHMDEDDADELAGVERCSLPVFVVLHERFDIAAGERLIMSKPMLAQAKGEWRRYSELIGLAKSLGGSVPVRYYLPADQHGIGRFRCEVMAHGDSRFLPTYMSMLREVRAHLAAPHYWDVDIANSAPSLLLQTLAQYDIACPLLERYIAHRDASIAELQEACNVTRDSAKALFLRLMFMGGIPGWAREHAAGGAEQAASLMTSVPAWIYDLQAQLKSCTARLLDHPDFFNFKERAMTRSMKDGGSSASSSNSSSGSANGVLRSAVALAMQTRERQCLEALVEAVRHSERTIGALIHDGMHVERLPGERGLEEQMLREWQMHVRRRTGYDVSLKVKPFECNPAWLSDGAVAADPGSDAAYDPDWMRNCDVALHSYEDMKALWERNVFKVLDMSAFVRMGRTKWTVYSRQRLLDSFENLSYAVVSSDEDGTVTVKRHPFLLSKRDGMPCWLRDTANRTFESMEMVPPPAVCPKSTFNTWTGFPSDFHARSSSRAVDINSEGVQAYLRHIKILLGEDQRCVNYMLDWMAQIVQEPGHKRGIAIVLKGDEGVGKNRLTDLMCLLVGQDRTLETSKPCNTIFGRFTSQREGKLLIIVNEANSTDNIANADALKDAITSTTFVCESKGTNAYTSRCFARFIFTSNNDGVVRISPKDRRFVVLEVQSTLQGDKQYFVELSRHIECEHTRLEFMTLLKERDLSGVDWINDRPLTGYQRAMIELNLPLEHTFLRDEIILAAGQVPVVSIRAGDLLDRFVAWLRHNKHDRYNTNEKRFGMVMTSIVGGVGRLEGVSKRRGGSGIMYEFEVPVVRSAMVKANWISAEDIAEFVREDEDEVDDDPLGG